MRPIPRYGGFFLLLFLWAMIPRAQTGKMEDLLSVGKPCPDFLFTHIVNYSTGRQATVKNFRGKWLILDFWDRYCGACVKAFPHINEMQREFDGQVQFLLVGRQEKGGEIEPIFEKFRKRLGLNLPCAFDSALFNRLHIQGLPYVVTIDPRGIVRGISGGLRRDNIIDFLAGRKPALVEFSKESGNLSIPPDSGYLFSSALSKWYPSMPYLLPGKINYDSRKFEMRAADIGSLYMMAYLGATGISDSLYGKFNARPVLQVADPAIFDFDFDSGKNLFCYSLTVPPSQASDSFLMQNMQRDLKNYFGYEVSFEDRMMPCWNLVATAEGKVKLKTKGTSLWPKGRVDTGFVAGNFPMPIFIKQIARDSLPVIDQTGITGNIDITMDCVLTDFEDIKRGLRANGLDLVRGSTMMKVLVIGDPKITAAKHGASLGQHGRKVILISIDGLRPDFYLDPKYPDPSLQLLAREGTFAPYMKSVFPSYTYPSHVAMLTGALPARSGIYFNQPKNSKGEWSWFTSVIKVPTLWQALKHNGMTTAAVQWPVSVDSSITWNIPEIWDTEHPEDRISESRKYATKGLIEEIERNATGKLTGDNMHEEYGGLDDNAGRMAAYIFKSYKPDLLAVHFAGVDGAEHEQGRHGEKVRLALANVDHAIGTIMEAVERAGMKDSTTIIIAGDHGFSDIHTVLRPNRLIRDLPARFIAAGGSAFLYLTGNATSKNQSSIIDSVKTRLNGLPKKWRSTFRFVDRLELDRLGADSNAILALAAKPGIVFSGAVDLHQNKSAGPGTVIRQDHLDGFASTASGGHHGYDPRLPDMHTGFIAYGAGIKKGKLNNEIGVKDISPLIAKLLGVEFVCPDGVLVPGIVK